MAHVSVTINGRQFRMACEDGQETHLMGLAEDLDRRIEGLRRQFGEIGDTRLVVMAALTVADELVEMGQRLRKTEAELATLRDTRSASVEHSQLAQAAIRLVDGARHEGALDVVARGCAVRWKHNPRGLIDPTGAVPGRARGFGHMAPTYTVGTRDRTLRRPGRLRTFSLAMPERFDCRRCDGPLLDS